MMVGHRPYFLAGVFVLFVLLHACNQVSREYEQGVMSVQQVQEMRNPDDPFLTELYWELNRTPMQERLRSIRPFPVGVVYYQQRGDNLDSAKKEFQIMYDLGFTALKQLQIKAPYNPDGYMEQVYHAALDAGISPWYYGRGGWVAITQELVDELGIGLEVNRENMPAIQDDQRMIEYQTEQVKRPRVATEREKDTRTREFMRSVEQQKGEPGRNSPWIPERLVPAFAEWLEKTYGTVENLKDAWNEGYTSTSHFTSFMDAAKWMQGDGRDKYGNLTGRKNHDFRRFRDSMRFQADLIVANYDYMMAFLYDWDPNEPERTGGHQLFENQAANTWDLEGQAGSAAIGGSFYASIHLPHHFFLVDGELTKPVYMHSRIVADMFKGGWAATWESGGGPTFHSGYHPAKHDGGKMRQMMCSYIAAGLKGVGIWMWNSRGEGWEMGEFALTDLQGRPSDRAYEAGRLSQILQQQRFELWEALDEPAVGVMYSWEAEAMLGRMSLGAYPLHMFVYDTDWDRQFRQYHSQARTGVSRALINEHIPYENLTERDLAAGLADRYPIIFLPYTVALNENTFSVIKDYVGRGGRLVADFALLQMDDYGRLNKQHHGSDFEQLMGFVNRDYFHTYHHPRRLKDFVFEDTGYGDMEITSAEVVERFDDGTPAIINHTYGEGSVTFFNFEAGRYMFKPGRQDLERFVVTHTMANYRPPFTVAGANTTMVFRRSAPGADHYLFINDGEEETVLVSSEYIDYMSAENLIDGGDLRFGNNAFTVAVPAHSATWVRAEKE